PERKSGYYIFQWSHRSPHRSFQGGKVLRCCITLRHSELRLWPPDPAPARLLPPLSPFHAPPEARPGRCSRQSVPELWSDRHFLLLFPVRFSSCLSSKSAG